MHSEAFTCENASKHQCFDVLSFTELKLKTFRQMQTMTKYQNLVNITELLLTALTMLY